MAAATDTINKFKHIGTLLSQRKGHARVRQAPGIAVSAAPFSDTMRDSANLSRNKPNLGNPNAPPCASESFEFSQIPASCHGTGSTSFEECDSVNFEYPDDGHSVRGGSHIDLNQYHHDNSDYYEGSVNQFSMRGCYTQHIKARDCLIITNNYQNQSNNYSFSAKTSDNYPSSFDLNQEAPSLDNSSSSLTSSVQYKPPINGLGSKYNCDMPPSRPILAFPPPSQDQSFSFDARAQSAATALALPVPSASDTPSVVPSSDEDEFAELANKPTDLYEGAHSLINRQLAQIFASNPNLEAHLEKAACMIPTPTRSHISCISLEGNMTANGGLPPVQGPQSAVASMDQKGNSGGKRKCPSINSDDSKLTQCGNNPSKCHCSKRRKLKNKSIKRVPAISDKIAEIPHDDYSWRKYGQKPIKGSPYPRGYYKCSGVKGCPAKKHVERALDDPTMLIITYEGEHIHSKPYSEEPLQI